jgi:DeoR/GlpR family transcriptional regulator of sugar metabolism
LIFTLGNARVEELQRVTGTSSMTLYRDLADLEAQQVIVRSRGHVSAIATSLSETPFSFRLGQETAAKDAIAAAAARLIGRGDSVFVDDSTTAYAILTARLGRDPITVVTNAAAPIRLLEDHPECELIMIGGRYRRQIQAFYGPGAVEDLSRVHVDVAILGAAAIQDGTIRHPYEDVADFKRTVPARATRSILAVTAAKFSRSALHRVGPVTDVDVIVTDLPADDDQLADAVEHGVQVISTSS